MNHKNRLFHVCSKRPVVDEFQPNFGIFEDLTDCSHGKDKLSLTLHCTMVYACDSLPHYVVEAPSNNAFEIRSDACWQHKEFRCDFEAVPAGTTDINQTLYIFKLEILVIDARLSFRSTLLCIKTQWGPAVSCESANECHEVK
jgi:hypothetical protein